VGRVLVVELDKSKELWNSIVGLMLDLLRAADRQMSLIVEALLNYLPT
jgi:hypothetical protein